MFDWLRRVLGPVRAPMNRGGNRRASYDVAKPDARLDSYWLNADSLSAKTANSADVRKKLRDRSRYEYANNSYCQGVTLTIANELIGRGPRLQMRIPQEREANKALEQLWHSWAFASGLNEKFHVMAQAIVRDGEAPARMFLNPATNHEIKLNLDVFEAERLCTPDLYQSSDAYTVDGIRFDRWKNPIAYSVLRYHPGDSLYTGGNGGYDWVDARSMLHWFRADRPEQVRGIPWMTAALGLFAQLRRWTIAVLTAAETAADFAAILYTEGSPDTDQADPWDQVPINHGMMTSLPGNWKLEQFDAKQPVATYDQFKRELLKEIARCLNMPFNVVSGDSSNYNYASGRLDYQNWHRMLRVSRAHFERTILEKVFATFLVEAEVRNLLPPQITNIASVQHGWFWDAVQHVDPIKDGTGDSLALANNTDTLANICASQGLDWDEVLEQRGEEVARMRELGLEIYLPDFAVVTQTEAQQEMADGNNSKASRFSDLLRGRN